MALGTQYCAAQKLASQLQVASANSGHALLSVGMTTLKDEQGPALAGAILTLTSIRVRSYS